jgi:hypothetical protein
MNTFQLTKHFLLFWPVKIRVWRKKRLAGVVLRMRSEKQKSRHKRCGTIKIPPCSKALSAEHRPKFCSPSLVFVMWLTSPYELKILERDVKQEMVYMSINKLSVMQYQDYIYILDKCKLMFHSWTYIMLNSDIYKGGFSAGAPGVPLPPPFEIFI